MSLDSADCRTWGQLSPVCYDAICASNITSLYSRVGTSFAREWDFHDQHSVNCVFKKLEPDGSHKLIRYDALLPYTIVAFDTETMTMPEITVHFIQRHLQRLYADPNNRDHSFHSDRDVFDPSMIDRILSPEGVSDFESHFATLHPEEENEDQSSSSGDNDNECDDALHSEKKEYKENVHFPYCVSICYIENTITGKPLNFRNINGYFDQEALFDDVCFGEQLFQNNPTLCLRKKTFIGIDCMIRFCAFLGSSLFNDVSVQLIAHNIDYLGHFLCHFLYHFH